MNDNPKRRREIFMAHRELNNVKRLLAQAGEKLDVVNRLLTSALDPGGHET